MIKVRIIQQKRQSTLVEWTDEDGTQRVYVPTTEVDGTAVHPDVLAVGIPYGDPFDDIINLSGTDTVKATLIKELHKRGLYTADDVLANVRAVKAAVTDAYGLNVADVLRSARQYKEEHK